MKKLPMYLLVLLMFVLLAYQSIWADVGPKPSVRVEIEGLGPEEYYYVTLLSEYDSTGPYQAYKDGWSSYEAYEDDPKLAQIGQKFVDYQDPDGFYFLQMMRMVNQAYPFFAWTYYPPRTFKVLLYSPEEDKFISDNKIYQALTFDSVFRLRLKDGQIQSIDNVYNYWQEFGFFLARLGLTLLIEFLLALMFGFRTKDQLKIIMGVNIVTQVLLNIGLSLAYIYGGGLAFYGLYVLLEILVIIIEALVYYHLFKVRGQSPKNKVLVVVYALVANIASFLGGVYLMAKIMEGLRVFG